MNLYARLAVTVCQPYIVAEFQLTGATLISTLILRGDCNLSSGAFAGCTAL